MSPLAALTPFMHDAIDDTTPHDGFLDRSGLAVRVQTILSAHGEDVVADAVNRNAVDVRRAGGDLDPRLDRVRIDVIQHFERVAISGPFYQIAPRPPAETADLDD